MDVYFLSQLLTFLFLPYVLLVPITVVTMTETHFIKPIKEGRDMAAILRSYAEVRTILDDVSRTLGNCFVVYFAVFATIVGINVYESLYGMKETNWAGLIFMGNLLILYVWLLAYPNILLENGDLLLREVTAERGISTEDAHISISLCSYFKDDEVGIWLYICGVRTVMINKQLLIHFATALYFGFTLIAGMSNSRGKCIEQHISKLKVFQFERYHDKYNSTLNATLIAELFCN